MKAFQIASYKRPGTLAQVAQPLVQSEHALIAVEACGLNFADLLMMEGRYQEKPDLPFTLGMEIAGTVREVAPDVTRVAPGDRVAAYIGHSGLAELASVPADRCFRIPDAMPFETAAAFPVAYGTSHLALTRRAGLSKGETLVVLGAAGGVGLAAVEIGKALGARVIAVARGAAKQEVARAAGADHLIDSDAGGLRDSLRALGGVDVVYDPVGGDLFSEALRAVRPEGRVIVVGFASGDIPKIPANILLVKNINVIGYYWGGYMAFDPGALTGSLTELSQWYLDGRLKPHVSHVLPLERTAEAYDLLRQRTSTGKVVVRINS